MNPQILVPQHVISNFPQNELDQEADIQKNARCNSFSRPPLHLDRNGQLDFTRIQGYPHSMDNDIRTKMLKFSWTTGLMGEDHIKAFMNVMDNFAVEHGEVMMNFFMQSLVDGTRDWYRSLLNAHICTWPKFQRVFREQYANHIDVRFKLGR